MMIHPMENREKLRICSTLVGQIQITRVAERKHRKLMIVTTYEKEVGNEKEKTRIATNLNVTHLNQTNLKTRNLRKLQPREYLNLKPKMVAAVSA